MIPARVPSRLAVQARADCPVCHAERGEGCWDFVDGVRTERQANHRERIERAQAWLGRQLPLTQEAA